MLDPAELPRMPLETAARRATAIAAALAPYCERIEIAGSIRRRAAYCGDLDLVCLPKNGNRSAIVERCKIRGELIKNGEQYTVFRVPAADGAIYQLDLWFAHGGGGDFFAPDPPNFGVLFLARTGSTMHNVWIAQTATALGLHFNPHRGILRRNEVIASAEETDIFRALHLDFIRPEDRERH